MRLRDRRPEQVDINLTALIDVVFLLLIFFMVSTTFDKFSEIQISLPEADGEAVVQEPQMVELVIGATGDYFLDGQQVVRNDAETLRRALEPLAAQADDLPLVINADANTPHQAVITAMDAARKVGLVRISFVTKEPSPGTGD